MDYETVLITTGIPWLHWDISAQSAFQTSAAQLSAETVVCSGGRNEYYDFALLDETSR